MSDILTALEAMLPDLPDAVDRRRLGDRLSQSVEALKTADYHVGRLNAVLDLAELTQFGAAPPQSEMLSALREEAYEVGDALETAATDGDLRDAMYEYERGFQKSLASADQAIRTHWASLAANKFRSLVPLGDLLQRIGVAPDLARRLQDCGRRGQAPSNVGPLADLASRARALLSELETLQAERADAIGEGEVGDFVNALAEQRATLTHVTDGVRHWLEKNEALPRFSVVPR